MSIADFLDEYFESDLIKAHLSGSGIIGTAHGRVLAGHGLRAAAPLHGRRRRLDRRLGLRARRHGRGVEGDRESRSRPSAARSSPTRRSSACSSRGGRVDRRRDRERQRVPREHRRLQPRPEAHLPQALRREGPAAGDSSSARRTSRSAARRASSTSRSTGCRSSRRSARTTRCASATCISSIRSSRWSAPTTTGRTAPGRRSRTSTC